MPITFEINALTDMSRISYCKFWRLNKKYSQTCHHNSFDSLTVHLYVYTAISIIDMATKNPLTKIARQHEVTWTQLQKRISDVPYIFQQLFPDDMETFILRHKASSINSSLDTSYLPCFQQQLSCQRKMVAELPLLLASNR
jgi:hypothetical protein